MVDGCVQEQDSVGSSILCEFVEGIALFFKKQEECAALIRLYGRKRNPAETDRGKGWLR